MAELVAAVLSFAGVVLDTIGKFCPDCCGRRNTAESMPDGGAQIENNCCNCNWICGPKNVASTSVGMVDQKKRKGPSALEKETDLSPTDLSPQLQNATFGVITVGPWGHHNVGFPFKHKGYDSIKMMKIRCGDVIDSIYIEYRKPQGGKISKHIIGGSGGSERDEIIFEDGEYINKVIGSYGTFRENKTINSLTFSTNTSGQLETYDGKEEDGKTPTTRFSVEGGKIVGIYGYAGKYISAIGFYIRPVQQNEEITVGLWGHPNVGGPFEHKGYDGIKKMKIRCGDVIDSIDIEYRKPQGGEISKNIGGYGGSPREEIIFEDGEYINKVNGSYGTFRENKTINSLAFSTNMSREFGPYGKIMEEDGKTPTTPFRVEGGRIVGFYGNAGSYISAIGFYILP